LLQIAEQVIMDKMEYIKVGKHRTIDERNFKLKSTFRKGSATPNKMRKLMAFKTSNELNIRLQQLVTMVATRKMRRQINVQEELDTK
jgi:hypothetical protein